MDEAMPLREPTEGEPRIVESKTEARQGREFHRLRYILAISFIGAFAGLLIVYFFFAATN
jgi:hypothetical protein